MRFAVGTCVSVVLALVLAPQGARSQHLLNIPDLSVAADTTLESVSVQGTTRRGGVDFDLVGSMSPSVSERFWGETRASLLPGSSLGLASGRGSIFTEIGQVLSGSWRISIGSALAIASDDSAGAAADSAQEMTAGFGRFVAGGGNLALQGVRPVVLAKLGEYNRGALFFTPRAWVNVPELSSAEGISDYGGELAGSLLLQRHDNRAKPFLTLELRSGLVIGSNTFYQTIGRTKDKGFAYLAPTLTLTLDEQINIGVSSFISGAFEGENTVTLRLTLLNKKSAEDSN
jgi:hypothetical protein